MGKLFPHRLLVLNLPSSTNYATLKNILPNASRSKLFKKGSKRFALACFETPELFQEALEAVNGLEIDGVKVTTKTLSSQSAPTKVCSRKVTICNLPFSCTKAQLEEEFPTASSIVMNEKNGRFRGSCLLRFDTLEDCQTTVDSCRNRMFGGRRIRCIQSQLFRPSAAKTSTGLYGIRVSQLPPHVDESQLLDLFPKQNLVYSALKVSPQADSKFARIVFNSSSSQKAALKILSREAVFGCTLHVQRFEPDLSKKRYAKLAALSMSGLPNAMKTAVSPSSSSSKRKRKKRKHKWNTSGDLSATGSADRLNNPASSLSSSKKKRMRKKKKKFDKSGDLSTSGLASEANTPASPSSSEEKKKTKRKKWRKMEWDKSGNLSTSVLAEEANNPAFPSSLPKKKRKKQWDKSSDLSTPQSADGVNNFVSPSSSKKKQKRKWDTPDALSTPGSADWLDKPVFSSPSSPPKKKKKKHTFDKSGSLLTPDSTVSHSSEKKKKWMTNWDTSGDLSTPGSSDGLFNSALHSSKKKLKKQKLYKPGDLSTPDSVDALNSSAN